MNVRATGFSIIELIIVIVVVAIAAVAIGSAFAYMARSQTLSLDLQRATQIAQECADHVIGLARRPGSYALGVVPVALNSAICNPPAIPAITPGFTRTVNVSVMGVGALCAAGWACKRIEIIARRGSAAVTLNFMVVNY